MYKQHDRPKARAQGVAYILRAKPRLTSETPGWWIVVGLPSSGGPSLTPASAGRLDSLLVPHPSSLSTTSSLNGTIHLHDSYNLSRISQSFAITSHSQSQGLFRTRIFRHITRILISTPSSKAWLPWAPRPPERTTNHNLIHSIQAHQTALQRLLGDMSAPNSRLMPSLLAHHVHFAHLPRSSGTCLHLISNGSSLPSSKALFDNIF